MFTCKIPLHIMASFYLVSTCKIMWKQSLGIAGLGYVLVMKRGTFLLKSLDE